MNDNIMKGSRVVLIIFWIAIIYNLIFPLPGIFYSILLYALPILIIGHFAEWLMVNGKLKQAGYQGFGPFANVIIYGFAWWLPILKNQQQDSSN